MRPLEPDVLNLVRSRFQSRAVDKVIAILGDEALAAPGVQRAVLYLSDGSLSMLKHYAECARADVREVLKRAEYVMTTSESPMRVREPARLVGDTGLPQHAVGRPPRAARAAGRSSGFGGRVSSRLQVRRDQLKGSVFSLGKAHYAVAQQQGDGSSVRCLRRCDNVLSIVHLPLVFVLEQVSEHIDLAEVGN